MLCYIREQFLLIGCNFCMFSFNKYVNVSHMHRTAHTLCSLALSRSNARTHISHTAHVGREFIAFAFLMPNMHAAPKYFGIHRIISVKTNYEILDVIFSRNPQCERQNNSNKAPDRMSSKLMRLINLLCVCVRAPARCLHSEFRTCGVPNEWMGAMNGI